MDKVLNDDIVLAQEIVGRKKLPGRHVFSDISGIYRGTNEVIDSKEYKDAITDKERILSVIASGDQIINSILLGSKDIEGYDISRFPKYYLMLKLAAIITLSKDEYLDFFFGDIHTKLFSEELYSKLYPALEDDAKTFWDSLFDYFDPCEISESMLFRSEVMNKDLMIRNNPYLKDCNFEELKSKIGNITIRFHKGNIFNLVNNSMKGYDLVNLSNIAQYIPYKDLEDKKFNSFLESIPLNDDGVIFNYLISYWSVWLRTRKVESFDRDFDSGPLTVDGCGIDDGYLLYKRKGDCHGKY